MNCRTSNGSKLLVTLLLLALTSCADKGSPSNSARWAAGPNIGKLDLLAVDVVDEKHAWAAGDIDPAGSGGSIYASTDGGESWNRISSTPEVVASIFFISPLRGWVAGYAGRIERTDDGGRSWKTQRVERQGEVINSIFFADERLGWAAGGSASAGGLILRTLNGGDSWEQIATGRVESFWAVRFASSDRGWVVGEDGVILETSDGGATWTKQASGTSRSLMGLAISASGAFVAVGEAGTILRSEDGSRWSLIESGASETLNAVAAQGDVLWVVGGRGTTLGSSDGGRTWTAAPVALSRDLMAIDLASASRGVTVGQRGSFQLLR